MRTVTKAEALARWRERLRAKREAQYAYINYARPLRDKHLRGQLRK